jgi:hypothetical protein
MLVIALLPMRIVLGAAAIAPLPKAPVFEYPEAGPAPYPMAVL